MACNRQLGGIGGADAARCIVRFMVPYVSMDVDGWCHRLDSINVSETEGDFAGLLGLGTQRAVGLNYVARTQQ